MSSTPGFSRTRRLCAATGLAALAALAAAAPSHAATAPTFSGSCTYDGKGTLSPGLKTSSSQQSFDFSGSGTCDRGQTGAIKGVVSGPADCTGGQEPFTGDGTITVGNASIPVKMTFDLTLPNGSLDVTGSGGGAASGIAQFLNSNNGGQMGDCVANGLKNISFKLNLSTKGALTGDKPAAKAKKKKKAKKHGKKRHGKKRG